MTMKLRIAAPAPERTAEELTLVNRFAEYQTFLKEKQKEAKMNPQDAIARAKKILASREKEEEAKVKQELKLKRPSNRPNEVGAEEPAAKKARVEPALNSSGNLEPKPEDADQMDIAPSHPAAQFHDTEESVLCITGLPDSITEERLRERLGEYGFILSVELFNQDHYALVRFDEPQSVAAASAALDNTDFDGSVVSAYDADVGGDEGDGDS